VVRQRYCRLRAVVEEHGGPPRCDQSTPGDENEVFHALNAKSYVLRPFELANHIISHVVLKHPSAEGILALAVMRKRQKGALAPAPTREAFSTERASVDSISQRQDCDALARFHSARIIVVGLQMHIAGVVIPFGQSCFTDIGQWTNIQRLVTLWWYTMPLIRIA